MKLSSLKSRTLKSHLFAQQLFLLRPGIIGSHVLSPRPNLQPCSRNRFNSKVDAGYFSDKFNLKLNSRCCYKNFFYTGRSFKKGLHQLCTQGLIASEYIQCRNQLVVLFSVDGLQWMCCLTKSSFTKVHYPHNFCVVSYFKTNNFIPSILVSTLNNQEGKTSQTDSGRFRQVQRGIN